jgi:glycosyltransferase involved in cell wall biosynthesis
MDNSTLGFSLLVCTYNPDEKIFGRTLKSIESLIIPEDISVECIIVDNNSPTSVEQLVYVREFLEHCPWAKVIQVTQQGLTFARIAGFRAAKNPYIVFIDDDNEVSSSYLEALVHLFGKYPSVAAWGPGNVNVEFMGDVSDWFKENFKNVFQERHVKHNEYGCIQETWTSFYPFGTGLAVRKQVLERYCSEVKSGSLSSTDRQGKSLSSGGDIQIVWEAIKMGDAAGVAPSLAVTHLIPAHRSNLDYVKRLNFGAASSYLPCLTSSFPDLKSCIVNTTPSSLSIVRSVIRRMIKYSIKFKLRLLIIDLASYLGGLSGHYQVAQKNNPIVNFMVQQLKLR